MKIKTILLTMLLSILVLACEGTTIPDSKTPTTTTVDNSNRIKIDDVDFTDSRLEYYILQAKVQYEITYTDELKIFNNASGSSISSLVGLEYFTELEELNLNNTGSSSIEQITNLIKLKSLKLGNCSLTDISSLEKLTNLEYLYLSTNNISDITPLTNLTKLQYLSLNNNNTLTTIAPLSEMDNMTELYLWNLGITDISSLSKMTSLNQLNLYQNDVSNIDIISNMNGLDYIHLGGNANLIDYSPLLDVTNLTTIYVDPAISSTQVNALTSKFPSADMKYFQ